MARLRILFGLLGLAVIGGGLFLALHPASPLLYFLAHPKDYASCVKAHGTLQHDEVNSCIMKGQLYFEHTATKLKEYKNDTYGFGLAYDGKILEETSSEQQVPFFNKTDLRPVTILSHEVPIQHCGLSGLPEHCTPTTKDISITFMPLNMNFADLMAATRMGFGELQDIKLGSLNAKTSISGAEGEGNFYYFLPLGNDKSLMITRSFINEEIVGSYKNAKDFIAYNEQQMLFDRTMSTLKINK
jgi:hypothetical protein